MIGNGALRMAGRRRASGASGGVVEYIGGGFSMPTHEVGDLLLCFRYSNSWGSIPGLVSGYTSIATGTTGVYGGDFGWRAMGKIASSTSDAGSSLNIVLRNANLTDFQHTNSRSLIPSITPAGDGITGVFSYAQYWANNPCSGDLGGTKIVCSYSGSYAGNQYSNARFASQKAGVNGIATGTTASPASANDKIYWRFAAY